MGYGRGIQQDELQDAYLQFSRFPAGPPQPPYLRLTELLPLTLAGGCELSAASAPY
jgi:hypothetical protein